jgi:hypothetical protein
VRGLIGETWRLVRSHGRRMLVVALVLLLPAELAAAYADDDSFAAGTVASLLLIFVGYPWAIGALVATLERRGSPPLEPYGRTVPRVPALAVASFVALIAEGLALLLLVLPGLLLAARWIASPALIVIEGSGPIESLSRSNALVRGRTWTVLGALVVTILVPLALATPALVIGFTAESPWAVGLANTFSGVAFTLPAAAFSYAVYRAVRLT